MQIHFDEGAVNKIQPHLGSDKKLLLTFEDGVGPYSQHAMIHMQDLNANMHVHFNSTLNTLVLSGDGGDIDTNMGFIDFTQANGVRNNPAR